MKYIGNKSSDAEITIDLIKRVINFDYSLNSFGNPLNSNSSCTLQKERRKPTLKEFILDPFYDIIAVYARLSSIPFIQKRIPQYFAQKMLLWGTKRLRGLHEQQVIGKQETKSVTFYIPTNIWFEYELDGDYKDKISKIELRRRFIKKIYNYSSCFQQQGWNVIFTFTELPQYGYVILRSVN